jgi:HAD superfamily hydrolase (TIGR01509 family)
MVLCGDFTPASLLAPVRGLVFDCDGVLFNSYGANTLYYNLILEGMGLGPMNSEQESYVHSATVHDSLARIVPPGRMDEALTVRATIDYRRVLPAMVPEPGLYAFLSWALAAGYRMGVFTNRMTTMDMVADIFGLRQYFKPLLNASLVRPKPHPEGLHRILAAWGMQPGEMAFLGDSRIDEHTARAAGVRFWAYRSETLAADLHIPDYFALRRALSRVRAV